MANFGMIGGGEMHGSWVTIAEAAGGQTYAAQLTTLKSTWNNISENDKKTKQYRITRNNQFAYYSTRDMLSNFSYINATVGGGGISSININDCTYTELALTASSPYVSISNLSSTNDSLPMQLQMYVD